MAVRGQAILRPWGDEHGDAVGLVRLEEGGSDPAATRIDGVVRGLSPGEHGLRILTWADGPPDHAIYNPTASPIGARDDPDRAVGGLGNVTADAAGVARFSIVDKRVHLSGPWSVIGRAIAVATGRDDGGTSRTTVSKTEGSAGPPVAWGVIGLVSGVNWGDSVQAEWARRQVASLSGVERGGGVTLAAAAGAGGVGDAGGAPSS